MTPTHAGGLVFKTEGEQRLYLVITSSKNPMLWVLPKGHIEEEETPEFAAIREVLEETGVLAMPLSIAGYHQFQRDDEAVCVRYYLMKFVRDVTSSTEGRQQQWLSKEAAIEWLAFADVRKLLEDIAL